MTDTPNQSANAGNWVEGIADADLRGYVQQKQFADPSALAQSYRNLEKLQGVPADRLLKLPEKDDDPAWGDVHARLGRPAKPEDYGFKVEGDDAFAKRMAATMHKHGITAAQAKALEAENNTWIKEVIEADTQARQQKDAAEIQGLRTKWAGDYDKNVELGRRAGREFGLSEQEFKDIEASLGAGKTIELFAKIGAKLAEPSGFDPAGSGGGSGFGMTADQARTRIKTLQGDQAWTAKYLQGDAGAREEMDRLHRVAAGG